MASSGEQVLYDWGTANGGIAIALAMLLIASSGILIAYATSNISPSSSTIMIIVASFFIAIAVGCIVSNSWAIYKISNANDEYVKKINGTATTSATNPPDATPSTVAATMATPPTTTSSVEMTSVPPSDDFADYGYL